MAGRVQLSKTTIELGETVQISIQNRDYRYSYGIKIKIGYESFEIKPHYDGYSFDWTPPEDWARYITTGDRKSCQIVCETVEYEPPPDDWIFQVIGTSTTNITLVVPERIAPTVEMATSDPSGWFNTLGKYVEHISKIKVSVTSQPVYDSRIVSTEIRCGKFIETRSSAEFEVLRPFVNGFITVSCTVTDARGHIGQVTKSLPVTEYAFPTSKITDLYRCDAQGNEDPQGTYAQILYLCQVDPLAVPGVRYELRYRKRGTSSWTSIALTEHNGMNNVSSSKRLSVTANDAYDYHIRTTDRFTQAESPYRVLPVAFVMMDFCKESHSAGVGQAANEAETFLMGLALRINAGIKLTVQSGATWNNIGNYLDGLIEFNTGVQFFAATIGGQTWGGILFKLSESKARAEFFSSDSRAYMTKNGTWSNKITI